MKLSDLPPEYQLQAKEKLKKYGDKKTNSGNPSTITDKKRVVRHEPLETQTVTRFNRPVSITYITTRRRDTDRIAVEDKYFTDSLVTCKILRDDTKKDVASLDVREPEIGRDEKTVIEIEEV